MQFIENFTTAILFIFLYTARHSRCWFLRILHTFCVATTKTYTVPLDPHIVYCFNIYNTFVVLTTDNRDYSRLLFSFITYFPTIRANIASSWSTNKSISVINWGFYYCYFVYRVVYWQTLTLLIFNVFCIHFALQWPKPSPYRWNLTFYMFSTITIHMPF